MSRVFVAIDRVPGRRVVVKVLRPDDVVHRRRVADFGWGGVIEITTCLNSALLVSAPRFRHVVTPLQLNAYGGVRGFSEC